MKYSRLCLFSILSFLLFSCSSSEESDNTDEIDNDPFSMADPVAETVIERLGFTGARDAIEELVSAEYLNRYFDIEDELITGNLHSDSEPSVLDCPGGGTVSCISNGCIYPLSQLSYDNCGISGMSLTGVVERRGTSFPFASGGSDTMEETFTAFSISSTSIGSDEFSGTVKRTKVDSQFDTGLTREITVTRSVDVDLTSVRRVTEAGLTELSSNYSELVVSKTIVNVDESLTSTSEFTFDGEASIRSALFGDTDVTATKTGERIVGTNETAEGPATLSADFGETSTLALTAVSDAPNGVQVDIVSRDVTVSFMDTYEFAPRLRTLE